MGVDRVLRQSFFTSFDFSNNFSVILLKNWWGSFVLNNTSVIRSKIGGARFF